jgi:uncharacterized membrane protein YtjA (UPF0391 family)
MPKAILSETSRPEMAYGSVDVASIARTAQGSISLVQRNRTLTLAFMDWVRDGYLVLPWRRTSMPGNLIYYALVLIVIALVATLFGFGGVASTAMGGAHLLIWLAVVIVVVGVVFALIRRA